MLQNNLEANQAKIVGGLSSFEFTPTTSSITIEVQRDCEGQGRISIDNINLQVSTEAKLAFFYDDRGQRVRKEVYNSGNTYLTYYVRDASGSPMGIYSGAFGPTIRQPTVLTEQPIYGSSRLGVHYRESGTDAYQLTDHLGNVRAVIMKNGGNAVSLTAKTDYYPGGMAMPNRNIVGNYRYGYQGNFAETDPETGMPAFEARLYDTRINRWLTVDPNNQFHSPYVGMGNYFTTGIDPDGRDVILLHDEGAPYGMGISGHTAVLIGNDDDGYTFYNKTGNTLADGSGEVFKDPTTFKNINEFYEAYGKSGSYQAGVHITTSKDVDALMIQKAEELMNSGEIYGVAGGCNCSDFTRDVIEAGGIDLGPVQRVGNITWPRAEFINAYNQTNGNLLFFQDARNKLSRHDFRASNLSFFQNVVGLQNLQNRSRFFTNHKPKVTIEVGELQQLPYED